MSVETLEADYLVVGAGAMGMAFSDEILTQQPNRRIVMVDRHSRPGGHWHDAYSFVSLHQPAAYYGVNSEKLGSGGAELASRAEILAYYERVLRKLSGTAQLKFFPMCEYEGDGSFRSTVDPDRSYRVTVRRQTVDATYMNVRVPSIRPPVYQVAPGVALVPPNELPRVREPRSGYVIIGAGKTSMDAVLFLLDHGVESDRIRWIMPNDAWLLDRAQIQPGRMTDGALGSQMQVFAQCGSLKELFMLLESRQRILRLDEGVWPTKYRCATVTRGELDQLRQVKQVVRMGRVISIEPDEIVLEQGRLPTGSGELHVDCTADGLAKREVRPVFDGATITLQSLFMCQQVFSSAVIGKVESLDVDEKAKNELCQVVPHPEFSRDFVAASAISMENIGRWGKRFGRWLRGSRLFMAHHESLSKLVLSQLRDRRYLAAASENLTRILEQEFGSAEPPA